jgi:hypothetical protein
MQGFHDGCPVTRARYPQQAVPGRDTIIKDYSQDVSGGETRGVCCQVPWVIKIIKDPGDHSDKEQALHEAKSPGGSFSPAHNRKHAQR